MELGPVFFSFFFWVGLAVLLAGACVLRFANEAPEGPAARRAADAGVGAAKLVHTIRRGRVRLSIWAKGVRGCTAAGHEVRVDRRGPDCGDCMSCMNQALRWIHESEATP
jgi:hypothetical protein